MVSDTELAALVEIARSAGAGLSREGRGQVGKLLARGYVSETDRDGDAVRLKLTPAGQAVLDERGVGANES